MKCKLPWRAHNPTGWAETVGRARLTPLGEWALLRLLDAQWVAGSISESAGEVLGLLTYLGLDRRRAREVGVVGLVSGFFPVVPDDPSRRQNLEILAERARAASRAQSLSERNQRAAQMRWQSE